MTFWLINPKNEGVNTDLNNESYDLVYMGWNANDCPKFYNDVRKEDVIIVTEGSHYNTKLHYIGIADFLEGNCWHLKYSTDTKNDEISKIIRNNPNEFGGGSSKNPWGPTKSIIQLFDNPAEKQIKQVLNEYFMEKQNSEFVSRLAITLQANYNLILTGAPGTGKTYLAKQIARQIVSKTEKEKPINVLKEAIEKYVAETGEEEKRKNLLDDFLSIYPKEKLQEMSLEEYCIGNSDVNNNNFCYWMERRLEPLGRYFPGSSKSYLIYWNKTDEEYKVHGYLKTLSDKPEEVMKTLAKDISNMVVNDDPTSMAKKIGESFILKILSVYYPNEYAPINSRVHINNIISLFGIRCDNDNVFDRNKAIYRFYKEQIQEKQISPWAFMSILYNNFNIKDGEVIQDGVIKKEGDFCIVQFHPSYDYTDFVEGLRPKQDENGNMGFERKNGVFKELCITALKNPNKKYVLIIDEINRGEISKIFGELFFSIDPGYRGVEGLVKTQYQNLVEEDDEYYDGFYVPENVYIIGTMNDIDRSVESMDFAFRRRFAFKEITAKDSQKMFDSDEAWGKDNNGVSRKPNEEELKKIKEKLDALNNLICPEKKNGASEEGIDGLSSAYHIGASYFLKLVNYKKDDGTYDYDQLWDNHLEGLLFEYMRGTTDVSEKIKKLAIAFGYSNMEKYE